MLRGGGQPGGRHQLMRRSEKWRGAQAWRCVAAACACATHLPDPAHAAFVAPTDSKVHTWHAPAGSGPATRTAPACRTPCRVWALQACGPGGALGSAADASCAQRAPPARAHA